MSEPRRIEVALESAMSLYIKMSVRGQSLGDGTGFVVQHGGASHLITNRHCLSGRRTDTNEPISATAATPDKVMILHNTAGRLGVWRPVDEPVIDEDGQPLWLEHPDYGRHVDVVALPLTKLDDVGLYPYDLTPPERPVASGVSRGLSIVGFPFGTTVGGVFAVWTRGFVASEPEVDFHDLPLFLIDSRTRRGQSGSPVIFYAAPGIPYTTAKGTTVYSKTGVTELLGVYSGRINDESDLGMVWKTSAVRRIVEAGVRPPAP